MIGRDCSGLFIVSLPTRPSFSSFLSAEAVTPLIKYQAWQYDSIIRNAQEKERDKNVSEDHYQLVQHLHV